MAAKCLIAIGAEGDHPQQWNPLSKHARPTPPPKQFARRTFTARGLPPLPKSVSTLKRSPIVGRSPSRGNSEI